MRTHWFKFPWKCRRPRIPRTILQNTAGAAAGLCLGWGDSSALLSSGGGPGGPQRGLKLQTWGQWNIPEPELRKECFLEEEGVPCWKVREWDEWHILLTPGGLVTSDFGRYSQGSGKHTTRLNLVSGASSPVFLPPVYRPGARLSFLFPPYLQVIFLVRLIFLLFLGQKRSRTRGEQTQGGGNRMKANADTTFIQRRIISCSPELLPLLAVSP